MNTYAYIIKAKAKATDSKASFVGSLQNQTRALNAKFSTFWKITGSKLDVVLTTSCQYALTGLLSTICLKKVRWMTHGVIVTSLARMV